MTFNLKSKVYEFNIVTECVASHAHKRYFIDIFVMWIRHGFKSPAMAFSGRAADTAFSGL